MKRFTVLPVFLAFVLCLTLVSCNFRTRYDSEFFSMDTVMTISAYGKNSENAVTLAKQEVERLDKLFSVENKNSEIYKLNHSKTQNLSADTLSIIKKATEIAKLSDGAFDITTEPLTRAWGFYSDTENKIPDKTEIDTLLKSVGTEHLKISDSTVTLDKDTSIDLGGIAKGFTASRVSDILRENSVSSAIISLGGNVTAVGKKPDGKLWNVSIADPDDNSKQIGTLSVTDCSVVTSGGYQRYFEQDGVRYHHIIDPKTGVPSNSGLKSVTIVSVDDTLADALSTAIFVMGIEKASDLYKNNTALFDMVLVTDSLEIYITKGLESCFSSQRKYEVIKP